MARNDTAGTATSRPGLFARMGTFYRQVIAELQAEAPEILDGRARAVLSGDVPDLSRGAAVDEVAM